MEQTVLTLALELGGYEESEATGLALACRLAVQELTGLLKSGVSVSDCGEVFAAAAARMALSDWLSMRGATCPKKFTAGELSVEEGGSDPALLRRQALRQMSGYLKQPGFCFRGVRA